MPPLGREGPWEPLTPLANVRFPASESKKGTPGILFFPKVILSLNTLYWHKRKCSRISENYFFYIVVNTVLKLHLF